MIDSNDAALNNFSYPVEDRFTAAVRRFAVSISVAVWGLGFMLWLPLLLQQTLIYCGALSRLAITGKSPVAAELALRRASQMWIEGFRRIMGRVSERRLEDATPPRSSDGMAVHVAIFFLRATLFWMGVFAIAGRILA